MPQRPTRFEQRARTHALATSAASAILAVLFASIPAYGGPIVLDLFRANRAFETGGMYTTPMLGDFNRDGHLDVIAPALGRGMNLVLLSNGAGELTPASRPSDVFGTVMSVGDFTGDGILDVLTQSAIGTSPAVYLALYRGAGDGTFSRAGYDEFSPYTETVVTTDLDLDGRLDYVATPHSNALRSYYGDGGDSLPRAGYLKVQCKGVVPADFSGDGFPDLVLFSEFTSPRLLVGSPARAYAWRPFIETRTERIWDLIATDLNRDGHSDLVLTDGRYPSTMKWWLQKPGGGLDETVTAQSITLQQSAVTILAGDWNRDGTRDLVVTNDQNNSAQFTTLLGDGRGGLSVCDTFKVEGEHWGSCVGDVTDDGIEDLVFGSRFGVVVAEGHGDGTFGVTAPFCATGTPVRDHAVGDLDGDGILDVAYGGGSSWVRGLPDGTLGPTRRTPLSGSFDAKTLVADFDGDGIDDVAVKGSDRILCARGGSGGPSVTLEVVNGDGWTASLGAGDLDGDGRDELIRFAGYRLYVYAFESGQLRRRFEAEIPLPSATLVRDVDHDGKDDIVLATTTGIAILPGRSGPSLGPVTRYATRGGALALAGGDLNEDGRVDLVAVGSQFVSVLTAIDGGYRTETQWGLYYPSDAAADDFDGDGHLDIAIAANQDGLMIWRGDGTGQLRRDAAYQTGEGLAVGDFDRDGAVDVVTRSPKLGRLSVLRNQTGVPRRPRVFALTPRQAHVGAVVRLSGLMLRASSRVTVGGLDARFRVVSDEVLELVVPHGAPRASLVVVTTPLGDVLGPDLTVHAEAVVMEPIPGDSAIVENLHPTSLEVGLPRPSPALSAVHLSIRVPHGSAATLDVFSSAGRYVHRSARGHVDGRVNLTWDLTDGAGRRVPPGLYWLRVTAGHESTTRRVVVL